MQVPHPPDVAVIYVGERFCARLSASSLLLMALACGLCAGGNYFNQPLLHSIASHFSVSESAAATSVTLAQVAYAAGLLLLAPLGDKLQRRGLAVSLMLLAALGQALCGLASQFDLFLLGTLMAGLFSVAAQVLVPMAAALAQPGQSGRAVGWVMSGLLLGILLARSVAGMVSEAWGWQAVYQGAALVMAVVALWLWKALPASRNPVLSVIHRCSEACGICCAASRVCASVPWSARWRSPRSACCSRPWRCSCPAAPWAWMTGRSA